MYKPRVSTFFQNGIIFLRDFTNDIFGDCTDQAQERAHWHQCENGL